MTTRRALRALSVAATVAVLLAACGADDGGAPDAAPSSGSGLSATASDPTPTPTGPSPEPSAPSPEPAPDRPTAPPSTSVDAGTVAGGSAALAEGEGDTEVTFVRDGEFAVVIELDCARCEGATVLTGPGRGSPFGEADGALAGEYLMDVFEGSAAEQSVWIAADGPWTLRFSSWDDLTPEAGPWSGTGSTVIFLGGDSEEAEVSWTPADADDSFQGRYFGTDRAAARMFGDSEEFTDVVELVQPGVLAITTDGGWTVTPG